MRNTSNGCCSVPAAEEIEARYLFSDMSVGSVIGRANQPDGEAHLYYGEINQRSGRRQTWAGVAVWLALVCPILAFCIHVTPLS